MKTLAAAARPGLHPGLLSIAPAGLIGKELLPSQPHRGGTHEPGVEPLAQRGCCQMRFSHGNETPQDPKALTPPRPFPRR